MTEFLQMGGYAKFVWPSYGLALLVLWLNWYIPSKQHDSVLRQLKRRRRPEKE